MVLLASLFMNLNSATITGSNYAGADLKPNNGDILSGTFTNVGEFRIQSGYTVYIAQGTVFSITARCVIVEGTLDATGKGYAGGALGGSPSNGGNGSGSGGGYGGVHGPCVHGSGGGGGGYGGNGGNGSIHTFYTGGGAGGSAYGSSSFPGIDMGSGGGAAASHCNSPGTYGASGAGGNGGGAIEIISTGKILVSGSILANGAAGGNGQAMTYAGAGGGGGSGGSINITALSGFITGTLSAKGGKGGDAGAGGPYAQSGGGGGGGRIKITAGLCTDGSSISVSGGVAGCCNQGSGTNPSAGSTGTVSGGVTCGTTPITANQVCNIPASVDFDGSDDNISGTGALLPQGNNSRTVELWVKTTASSGTLFNYGTASSNNNFALTLVSGTANVVAESNDYNTGVSINNGAWHHFAATFDTDSLRVYIDGVIAGASKKTYNTSGTNFKLGERMAPSNNDRFAGRIDEIRVWSVARSATQIKTNMYCEPAAQSGLVAVFHANNGDPGMTNTGMNKLFDESGNSYTGTLNNFALAGSSSNWQSPAVGHEIDITGNSISITNGDNTPSTSDNTDFGSISTGTIVKTFTIKNTGAADLYINGISISGSGAGSFSAGSLSSSSPITAGNSATFNITFTPSSLGAKTATVTIANNDCDESNYTFDIKATKDVASALHFDGWNNTNGSSGPNVNTSVYDYVKITDNGTMDLNNTYTLEAWVYPNDNTNNTIIDKGDYRYLFQTHPNGQTGLGLYNSSMGWIYSAGSIPVNTWSHVAVSFDYTNSEVVFYLNGAVLSRHTSGLANPGPDNGDVNIGRQQPGICNCNNFDGKMDELRVWTRVLCQAEIQQRMNCEMTLPQTGLAAYFQFNQGVPSGSNTAINTLTDATGNGNTGTLMNFALSGSTSNWVNNGGVTSGTSCSSLKFAEISVKGKNVLIADNDLTPSNTDNTNFGVINFSDSVTKTFKIFNTDADTLRLTGTQRVAISGAGASKFSVSTNPALKIAPGDSTSFSIKFKPTTNGIFNATLTIENNDCDERVYDFSIAGEGGKPCDSAYARISGIGTFTSAYSYTTPGGWKCFCDINNKLMLSLKLGGTGAVVPDNGVSLKINSNGAVFYAHGTGFVGNYTGWAGLNRTWNVAPSTQPTSAVPVRFYFTQADVDSVNKTLTGKGFTALPNINGMSYYKVINSSKPSHSAVNTLAQSDVRVYMNGTNATDSTWKLGSMGGSSYYAEFKVNSFSGGGGGGGSGGSTPLPVRFLNLKAYGVSNTYIKLQWSSLEDEPGIVYEIERSTNGKDFTSIGTLGSSKISMTVKQYQFSDYGVQTGISYYYRIKTRNAKTGFDYSNLALGTLQSHNGIAGMAVYPNPGNNVVEVKWAEKTENAFLYIYGVDGQLVYSQEVSNLQSTLLNTTGLSAGIYHIHLNVNGTNEVRKLIVQH